MKTKINPMQLWDTPRCGAKTRLGTPCQAPAMQGKKRCRMHGGNSPGAPRGNQYALKSGAYTRHAMAQKREVRAILKALKALIEQIK